MVFDDDYLVGVEGVADEGEVGVWGKVSGELWGNDGEGGKVPERLLTSAPVIKAPRWRGESAV